MAKPDLIAIDWGTTRLRAWLVDEDGVIVDTNAADDGIMHVPPGGFPETLRRHVGAWIDAHPAAPVVMAGMVGSRNGWVEAPYVSCPTDLAGLATALARVDIGEGRTAAIVPGLSYRDPSGSPDVIRGEETKLAGCGLSDGTVVMPGTHCKWARLEGGRIAGFTTFMTGEIFGALKDHTILGRLAEEPADDAGFARGLAAARRPGGLTHQLFSTRSSVLLGDMSGREVVPFLSGLLIGTEVDNGLALCAPGSELVVVAEGLYAAAYAAALSDRGCAHTILAPDAVFVAGLRAIAAAGARRA
ncbi:MAG: 2-dehydro-3-deoxygalactonokinase [Alsobacter sp.]|nr:2-dehydro-3-deoxygalactonokinase [Burkholderiales bacterium]